MPQLNELFLGAPHIGARNALGDFLKGREYGKYIIPCTGRFAIANTIVNTGVKPENIITSDISLFSSIIGYYLAGKDISELDIKTTEEISKKDYIAPLLFAIKKAQIKPKNYYMQAMQAELEFNKELYITHISAELQNLKQKLHGITYELKDMWQVLDEWKNKDVFIFINPPVISHSYTKQFNLDSVINWNAPSVEEFNPKEYKRMLEVLSDINATVVVHSSLNFRSIPAFWSIFYAKVSPKFKITYMLSNKDTKKRYLSRNKVALKPLKLPILSQNDALKITEDSVITFLPVHRDTGDYYRDLFVHRIGTVSAEQCWLSLVDGKIFGTLGLHLADMRRGRDEHIMEVHGITRSFTTPRLTRLFMRLITSKEFTKEINVGIFECRGVKTTCLVRDIDIKRNKGILTLLSRELLKNDLWKVKYKTDWHNKTYKECIKEWLDEEGQRGRNKKGRKRKPRTSSRSR